MPGHMISLDVLVCFDLCLKGIQCAICPGVVMTPGFFKPFGSNSAAAQQCGLEQRVMQWESDTEHMRGVDGYELGIH